MAMKYWRGPLASAPMNDDGLILAGSGRAPGGAWRHSSVELRPASGADFYPTESRLPVLAMYAGLLARAPRPVRRILDLGAGAGVWGRAARRLWPGAKIVGAELRYIFSPFFADLNPARPPFDPDAMPPTVPWLMRSASSAASAYDYWLTGSALDPVAEAVLRRLGPFDLVIGNPPFSIAESLIRLAWRLCDQQHGRVFMLLRGAYLESKARYDGLYNGDLPLASYWPSVSRVSFTGNGKSDMTMYACFCWDRAYTPVRDSLGIPHYGGSFFECRGNQQQANQPRPDTSIGGLNDQRSYNHSDCGHA